MGPAVAVGRAVAVGVAFAVALVGCSRADDAGTSEPADSAESSPSPSAASTPPTATSSPVPPPALAPAADSTPLLRAACDDQLVVRTTGSAPDDLTSISGFVASRREEHLVWAIEDSFEPPALTALSLDGTEGASVTVRAGLFPNVDWEDVAIDVGPSGTPQIYIADIGDNLGIRSELKVLVVEEPALDATTTDARTITMSYRQDAGRTDRPNAEALVVQDGTIWVIDKNPDGPATVYRLQPDPADPDRGELVAASTLDLPGEQVTAVDLSPDGTVLALRTGRALRLYSVDAGADIATALAGTACTTPTIPEAQGESVAVLMGSAGLVTISEDESGGPVEVHLTAPT